MKSDLAFGVKSEIIFYPRSCLWLLSHISGLGGYSTYMDMHASSTEFQGFDISRQWPLVRPRAQAESTSNGAKLPYY